MGYDSGLDFRGDFTTMVREAGGGVGIDTLLGNIR